MHPRNKDGKYEEWGYKSLWRIKTVKWHAIPAAGVMGGIVALWNEERVVCKDVLLVLQSYRVCLRTRSVGRVGAHPGLL